MGEACDPRAANGLAGQAAVMALAGGMAIAVGLAIDGQTLWLGLALLLAGALCRLLQPRAGATLAWDEHGLERRARWGGWRHTWDELDAPTLRPGPGFVLRQRDGRALAMLSSRSFGDDARPLFEMLRGRMARPSDARIALDLDRPTRITTVVAMALMLGMAALSAFGAVSAATHRFRDSTPTLDIVNAAMCVVMALGLALGAVAMRGGLATYELDHEGVIRRLGRRERRLAWSSVPLVTLRRDVGGSEQLVLWGDQRRLVLSSAHGSWLEVVAWVCRHAKGATFRDGSRHPCSPLWLAWLAEAAGIADPPPAPPPRRWPSWAVLSGLLLLAVAGLAATPALIDRNALAMPVTRQRTAEARVTRVTSSPLGGRLVAYEFRVGSKTHTGQAASTRLSVGQRLLVVYRDDRPNVNRPSDPPPDLSRVALLDRRLRVESWFAAFGLVLTVLGASLHRFGSSRWALPSRQLG